MDKLSKLIILTGLSFLIGMLFGYVFANHIPILTQNL